jgi:hypothetical protein
LFGYGLRRSFCSSRSLEKLRAKAEGYVDEIAVLVFAFFDFYGADVFDFNVVYVDLFVFLVQLDKVDVSA